MNETVYLSHPRSRLRIEYSRAAMEQIRKRAWEGLLAAPRVGMGVGGLLLGVREDRRVRLLDSIDIPCSHSGGPSFSLTEDEKREMREMIAEAGAPGVSGKVSVLGWYCSKTRGDATLSQSDLKLHSELFPGPWHVALVVRPNVAEAMRAAFFFRDERGAVRKGAECDVEEWRPAPDIELPVPEKPVELPETVETSQSLHTTGIPETRLADIIDLSLSEAGFETGFDAGVVANSGPVRLAAPKANRRDLFGAPSFAGPRPRPRRKLRQTLPIAAAVVVAAAGIFFTRDFWMPKPPLTLTATELNGSLLIRWNPDALRGIDHGSLFVNDGGQRTPALIPLDRYQLNSGLLTYTPKSQRVTAKLDAGDSSAIAAWFALAPEPAAAAEPRPLQTKGNPASH